MEKNKDNVNNNNEASKASVGSKMVKGATVLAIAGIICKLLGAVFRIPLTNLIGAEGMSYYGVAYPVYSFFLILATAGLPVAISRMVSARIAVGDYRNAHRTYKVSLKLMLILGAISFSICFFGADLIASAQGNPGAAWSLRALAPAILIAPVVSSYRGYYQGQQDMMPTGVSQVFEQFIRVAVGLTLSFMLAKKSLEYAAAGATFGASAGLLMALVVLSIMYARKRIRRTALINASQTENEPTKALLKELVAIAIPITIGSAIMPFMMMIDSAIIMNRLQATGWSLAMSKTLYGLISGYTDPLIAMPGVFIDAMTISLMPAVTAAFTIANKEELKKTIRTGIKTMMVIAYPCAVGLIVLARPILYMLYPTKIDEAEMAVSNLQILSLTIITLSAMRTFSSALQGVGKMVLPVVNLFIGALAKIVVSYVLVGIPALNINGAAIGSITAYLVAAILNYRALKKYSGVELGLRSAFTRPLGASAIMGAATFLLYKLLHHFMGYSAVTVLISIIAAVTLYFVLIFTTGTVTEEEALLLPKGDLIVKTAKKLRLIKQ